MACFFLVDLFSGVIFFVLVDLFSGLVLRLSLYRCVELTVQRTHEAGHALASPVSCARRRLKLARTHWRFAIARGLGLKAVKCSKGAEWFSHFTSSVAHAKRRKLSPQDQTKRVRDFR